MIVDETAKPSRLDSVTTSLRALSLRGSTRIQRVRLSPGDASVRLTRSDARTWRSLSPAASGIEAKRTKDRARTRGRHIRNRRIVSCFIFLAPSPPQE